MWTNTPPSNTWMRTIKKCGRPEVEEDLGEDVWMSRTDEFTKDQEEADKEEQYKDDQEQERDKMTSRSGPIMGHP